MIIRGKKVTLHLVVTAIYARLKIYGNLMVMWMYDDASLKRVLQTSPYDVLREKAWKALGNKVGKDVKISAGTLIVTGGGVKPGVVLGDRVSLGPGIVFIEASGPNNSKLKGRADVQRYIKAGTINVGEDTWIGTRCIVHPGITIGKRCIIGAGSNVTKDIPDDVLAYGNPIRIVKKLGEKYDR